MAKLNMYEQQTAFNAPRADASSFGGGAAGAVAGLGNASFDLGVQMKRREDVIDRVQRLNEFDTYAQEALTAVNDTDDIAKKSTVDGLANGLRQRATEILNQHGGTAASRAELQAQLTNQAGQYIKSATAAQVKAQQAFIGRQIEQRTNALALAGSNAPETMPLLFEELDHGLAQFGDAMSPEQQAAYKEAGRSAIATGTVDKLLANGNWQGAKALMANPEVHKYMDRNAARRFNIDIAVDERKGELEVKRREDNVKRFTQLVRRDLTPEERQRAYDMPEKKNMTAADKITELEIIKGRPASQGEINEILDVENGTTGGFGNSMEGKAWAFVTQNAMAYANGLLSEDQKRMYDSSLAIIGKPITRVDPLRGTMETIQPEMPPWVRQAVQQGQSRGSQVAQSGSPTPGQRVRLTDAAGNVVGEAMVGSNGAWTIQNGNPNASWASERPANTPPPSSVPTNAGSSATAATPGRTGADRTIWDRRANIAGPIAAGASALREYGSEAGAVVAGAVMGEEQVRQIDEDRQFVSDASRDMITILQNSPQFAEGERKALQKELSIGPEVLRSASSYEAKLIGISQSLTARKFAAQQMLASDISKEARQQAMDRVAIIDKFMSRLGVPPSPSTVEEYNSLPSGTSFIDKKGQEWVKP